MAVQPSAPARPTTSEVCEASWLVEYQGREIVAEVRLPNRLTLTVRTDEDLRPGTRISIAAEADRTLAFADDNTVTRVPDLGVPAEAVAGGDS